MDFCLGKENTFLDKPFNEFNRIEIDLTNRAFFAEKLEIKQHLKRTQVFTSYVKNIKPKDQVSLVSKPQEQSLRSFLPQFKNSEIASSKLSL
jgi:hypothetical protein